MTFAEREEVIRVAFRQSHLSHHRYWSDLVQGWVYETISCWRRKRKQWRFVRERLTSLNSPQIEIPAGYARVVHRDPRCQCGLRLSQHVGDQQCLYQPTTFAP
jgi:hypothetical protein